MKLAPAFVLSCMALASSARAYSDPDLFTEQTITGGAGRRYFTGSPVDGYTCAVCHRGGIEPRVSLRGLPRAGYVPGQTYTVELSWLAPELPHALQLELVTKSGTSPSVQIAADGPALDLREYCGQNPEFERATYLIEESGRRIVGVRDCHAGALTFQFVAPAEGELAFAATLVRSDSSASTMGDGVAELAVMLSPVGSDTTVRAGCQIAAPGGAAQLWTTLGLLGLFPLGRVLRGAVRAARARSQRNAKLSKKVPS